MGMVKEFREFALKGSLIDLAVAVVIGAAFGKVITSFVDNVLMPPLGILVGKHDLSDYFITLSPGHYESLAQAKAAAAATLNYGLFIKAIGYVLIIALAIFLVVRQINAMSRQPEKAPNTRECPQCLSAIPIYAKRCTFCTVEV